MDKGTDCFYHHMILKDSLKNFKDTDCRCVSSNKKSQDKYNEISKEGQITMKKTIFKALALTMVCGRNFICK